MKWISVKDQLPPHAGDYLTYAKFSNRPYDWLVEISRYTKRYGWEEDHYENITHWCHINLPDNDT